jgi:glycosyltransferase involved in cell wall biosynthesis
MADHDNYAIITPYCKENRGLLERCIRSVQGQTVRADHILVADGHPQDWLDNEHVRHIRLDRNHSDYGDTPRAIGALLAVSEGYAGVGLLDADNWLEPDHISSCIEAARRNAGCDYVIARRNLCRPDGSVIDVEDLPPSLFVDTSCFFFLPGSYHVVPRFCLIPQELASICDRVFFGVLKSKKLNAEIVARKTVNYHCLWPAVYRKVGEISPPEATKHVDFARIKDWLSTLNPRELDLVRRRCGPLISDRL